MKSLRESTHDTFCSSNFSLFRLGTPEHFQCSNSVFTSILLNWRTFKTMQPESNPKHTDEGNKEVFRARLLCHDLNPPNHVLPSEGPAPVSLRHHLCRWIWLILKFIVHLFEWPETGRRCINVWTGLNLKFNVQKQHQEYHFSQKDNRWNQQSHRKRCTKQMYPLKVNKILYGHSENIAQDFLDIVLLIFVNHDPLRYNYMAQITVYGTEIFY